MFRITRGISLDHSPAFPNPSLHFPNGAALPIHGEDETDPSPARPAEASDANTEPPPAPGASGESVSAEPS